jgi:hypothetical protein
MSNGFTILWLQDNLYPFERGLLFYSVALQSTQEVASYSGLYNFLELLLAVTVEVDQRRLDEGVFKMIELFSPEEAVLVEEVLVYLLIYVGGHLYLDGLVCPDVEES